MDIYAEVTKNIADDERLIFFDMYKKTPWLYDKILGKIYLITDLSNPEPLERNIEWVRDRNLSSVLSKPYGNSIRVLAEMLWVRMRDKDSRSGFIVDFEEYHKRKDNYIILDTFIAVVNKHDFPARLMNLSVKEYRDLALKEYEMITVYHLVVPRFNGEYHGKTNMSRYSD